jgi:hypothetical protein
MNKAKPKKRGEEIERGVPSSTLKMSGGTQKRCVKRDYVQSMSLLVE